VRLDPQLAEAHSRLGLELGRRGNDAAAVEQFGDAVRLKPDLVEARVNLAVALSKLGRSGEARDQFQEVLRRSPTNAAALRYLGSQGAL
ncbi:MAG TPA: tetratricopeptide repeat protein, partial [Methylomirabilota bacterium]|nr:tetratricopeptide repeat protein [Methylomirabilota bacterium]